MDKCGAGARASLLRECRFCSLLSQGRLSTSIAASYEYRTKARLERSSPLGQARCTGTCDRPICVVLDIMTEVVVAGGVLSGSTWAGSSLGPDHDLPGGRAQDNFITLNARPSLDLDS